MTTMITRDTQQSLWWKCVPSDFDEFYLPADKDGIFKLIEEDIAAYPELKESFGPFSDGPLDPFSGVNNNAVLPCDADESSSYSLSSYSSILFEMPNEVDHNTLLVSPITALPLQGDVSIEKAKDTKKVKKKKPKYHWTMDHDYFLGAGEKCETGDAKGESDDLDEPVIVNKPVVRNIPKEPEVEVWKYTEQSSHDVCSADFAAEWEPRRQSQRVLDRKFRPYGESITEAVTLARKKRARPSRITKPKNSVETTPYQSDFEEGYCQPVRQTSKKITKKKTTKGRIDHSESERHRREVLRTNFSLLCELIPMDFLRGEKASSLISKQKILTGAKNLLMTILSNKVSYKGLLHDNRHMQHKLHKYKLFKGMKRQK